MGDVAGSEGQSLQSRFEVLNESIMNCHEVLDHISPRASAKGVETTPEIVGATASAENCRQNLVELLARAKGIADQVGLL